MPKRLIISDNRDEPGNPLVLDGAAIDAAANDPQAIDILLSQSILRQSIMCSCYWLDLLERAIKAVAEDYYREYPVDWLAEKVSHDARQDWKATLAQFNERDWCYELYHQLRLVLDNERNKLPTGVRLSGESSKHATYNAVEHKCRWSKNKTCRIPDILLHDPLNQENQILAVEVKRQRFGSNNSVTRQAVKDDLEALIEYVQGLNFQLGVFIGVGIDQEIVKEEVHLLPLGSFGEQVNQIFVSLPRDSQNEEVLFRSLGQIMHV